MITRRYRTAGMLRSSHGSAWWPSKPRESPIGEPGDRIPRQTQIPAGWQGRESAGKPRNWRSRKEPFRMGVSANRREFHSTGWEFHSIGWEFHSLLPFSGLFLAVDGQKAADLAGNKRGSVRNGRFPARKTRERNTVHVIGVRGWKKRGNFRQRERMGRSKWSKTTKIDCRAKRKAQNPSKKTIEFYSKSWKRGKRGIRELGEKGGKSVGNRGMREEKAEGGRIHQNFDRTHVEGSFVERRKERECLVGLETHRCVALCVSNGEINLKKPERKEEKAERRNRLGERTFRCRTSREREVVFERSMIHSAKSIYKTFKK